MQFKSKQILLERFSLNTAELMKNYGRDVPVFKDVRLLDAELLDAEGLDAEGLDAEGLDAELLDAEGLDAELLDAELLDAEGQTQNCVPESGFSVDSQLQKSLVKCLGIGATVGELFPKKKS